MQKPELLFDKPVNTTLFQDLTFLSFKTSKFQKSGWLTWLPASLLEFCQVFSGRQPNIEIQLPTF